MLARRAERVGFALANAVREVGLAGFGGDRDAVKQLGHDPGAGKASGGFIDGGDPALIASGFGFRFGDYLVQD